MNKKILNLNSFINSAMELTELARAIQNLPNIKEKFALNPLLDIVREKGYSNPHVFAAYGEDSAALLPAQGKDQLVLFSIDQISSDFLKTRPYHAGYSAVFVAADDIYACGGQPLGCAISLGYEEESQGTQVMEGLIKATEVLDIPLVRGHTSAQSFDFLSISMVGQTTTEAYISAGNAQIGDELGLILDPEGQPGEKNKYYWNCIFQEKEVLQKKRQIMSRLAKKQYVHSAKDISNSGLFGTLLQMMELSKVGCNVDLNLVNLPPALLRENYDLIDFFQMYLTSSFLITYPPQFRSKIREQAELCGLAFNHIGNIMKTKKINICVDKEQVEVFDFSNGSLIIP